ncbi:MAG: hypothetical protein F7B18_06200 [Desulfurococcales archaeon]|nr:hypothetical protein [Desulfurococcales archaeon]
MKPRFPGRPRLEGALASQIDYILSRYSKAVIATTILVGLIYSTSILLALLPAGLDLLVGVGLLVMLIYLAVVVELAGNMAQELGSGEAALYLSTPLSRVQYVMAWIASLAVPAIAAYTVSLLTPLLVISPSLIARDVVWGLALGVSGEIMYYSVIIAGLAALLKRKNLVSIMGIALLLIAPLVIVFSAIIYTSVTGAEVSPETLKSLVGVFHPIILFDEDTLNFTAPIIYSLTSSLILVALVARYAARSLEV